MQILSLNAKLGTIVDTKLCETMSASIGSIVETKIGTISNAKKIGALQMMDFPRFSIKLSVAIEKICTKSQC